MGGCLGGSCRALHGTFKSWAWLFLGNYTTPQCTPMHIKRPVAPICPFTIFTPNMGVHFKFSEEQEWLSLCLRGEEMSVFSEGGGLGEGKWIWSLVCCRGGDWQALNLAPVPHKAMVQNALGSLGHAQMIQFCSLQRFTVAHFVSMAEGSRYSIWWLGCCQNFETLVWRHTCWQLLHLWLDRGLLLLLEWSTPHNTGAP